MTVETAELGERGMDSTRTRLLDTALRLFSAHGVGDTSLQMIADELGVTKAAVYYHFKTKHDIVEAVAEPGVAALTDVLDKAEAVRKRGSRIDCLLDGLVDVVVRYRELVALFTSDQGFANALEGALVRVEDVKGRLIAIMVPDDADSRATVTTHFALTGIMLTAAAPELALLDDDEIKAALLEAGRRSLGRPRRGSP